MNVENVDVAGAELLQGLLDRDIHGLEIVATVHDFRTKFRALAKLVVPSVLERIHEQQSMTAGEMGPGPLPW